MALKLKVKKTLLKRKVNGATLTGYYGRVITHGTKTVEDILEYSTHGNTLDRREGKLALDLIIDGITAFIKQGYIVDLGPVGKLYPAVNGTWKADPKELSLGELKPKVSYRPGEDIAAAVKGATLSWTTEQETEENTVSGGDDAPTQGGDTPAGGDGGSEGAGGGLE